MPKEPRDTNWNTTQNANDSGEPHHETSALRRGVACYGTVAVLLLVACYLCCAWITVDRVQVLRQCVRPELGVECSLSVCARTGVRHFAARLRRHFGVLAPAALGALQQGLANEGVVGL